MTAAIVTAADLLDGAADLIEERGWTQDKYTNGAGCLCARGAFHVAVDREATDCGLTYTKGGWLRECVCQQLSIVVAEYLALELLFDEEGNPTSVTAEAEAVERWNDSDGMTAGEVIDTLRAVARLERRRGDS